MSKRNTIAASLIGMILLSSSCSLIMAPKTVIQAHENAKIYADGKYLGQGTVRVDPRNYEPRPVNIEIHRAGFKPAHFVMDRTRFNGFTVLSAAGLWWTLPIELFSRRNNVFPKQFEPPKNPVIPWVQDGDTVGLRCTRLVLNDTLYRENYIKYGSPKKHIKQISVPMVGRPAGLDYGEEIDEYDMRYLINDFLMEHNFLDYGRYFHNVNANYQVSYDIENIDLHWINSKESKTDWYYLKVLVNTSLVNPLGDTLVKASDTIKSGEFTSYIPTKFAVRDALQNLTLTTLDQLYSNRENLVSVETSDIAERMQSSSGELIPLDAVKTNAYSESKSGKKGVAFPIDKEGTFVTSYETYRNRSNDTIWIDSTHFHLIQGGSFIPAANVAFLNTNASADSYYGCGTSHSDVKLTDDLYVCGFLRKTGDIYLDKVKMAALREVEGTTVLQLDGSFDQVRNPIVLNAKGDVIGCVSRNVQSYNASGISFCVLLENASAE